LSTVAGFARPEWLRDFLARPRLQRTRVRLRRADGTGYLAQVREFFAAIAQQRPPVTIAADGRRDLEIVLRGYEALEGAVAVAVPPCAPSDRRPEPA